MVFPLGLLPPKVAQKAAQRIDDPVERLERDILVLIAAAGEHKGPVVPIMQRSQELLAQRALARAGAAVTQHGHRASLAARREGLGQRSQLTRAADKWR